VKYQDPSKHCIACGKMGVDLHHIRTRKSGGSDEPFNLMPLSRDCHIKVHQYGLKRFVELYPSVKEFLTQNGWELQNIFGKKKWVR
jgi:5-methylcytosine-specific restriction endonuclease McrA